MNKSKLTQLIILLLFIPALLIIYYKAENHITALIYNGVLLLAFWIFRIISGALWQMKINSIIKGTNKKSAKIIAVKTQKNNWVLQLSIQGTEGPYITSYVLKNPEDHQKENYKQGSSIHVYINPKDQNDIIFPQAKRQKVRESRSDWSGIIWTIIIIVSVGSPFIIHLFDTSERVFKDMTYIQNTDSTGKIWEVRFESPKKIFIKIHDPFTNKTIKKIKDKKENEHDYYLNFLICSRDSEIVILGLGTTPIFDVYNATTFEKISGISQFRQSNKKLYSGIVKMEKESINAKFFKDNIVKIITTDGITCYYNIEKNIFHYTEKEMRTYIEKADKGILAGHLTVFALSTVSGSDFQDQLYVINSEKTNKLDELHRQAGSGSFDPERFNKDKRYSCKKCSARLLSDEKFLESRLAYYDSTVAVITSLVSMKKDDYDKITAIDKTGKVLFVINGSAYPNRELMDEKGYKPSSYADLKFIRTIDQMVITFKEYGALGIDLTTGKILWKYEP